ncbi:diflavin oxidoreductase [Carboxylicivirga marina]|uniref:diflavin oxidoreductase n=1 Tax=Carboxylicivirga marina TaxID=2800988 RepID=UPI002595CA05|nr:flavodoxin domain-containing protein [uncultured Carboxylicivirga sp.]
MSQYKDTLHIVYGSRTGNAKSVAVLADKYAKSLGYQSTLVAMPDMDYQELAKIENLVVIVSTHGEGEPPVQAEGFYDFLHSESINSVKAKYAVLGLGDSSYRYYCQTGEDISQRLGELGGEIMLPLVKCDIDFEETAKQWVLDVFEAFKPVLPVLHKPMKDGFTFDLKLDGDTHSAYKAELLEKRLLTSSDSTKKVLHVSLSLKNSGMDYLPGDAIGVYGTNSRMYVDELLLALNVDKAYPIKDKETTRLLKDVLIHDYELTLITPLVVQKYADISQNQALNQLLDDTQKLEKYAAEKDVLDMVMDYPGVYSVEEFLGVLRKLSQRLYSVASSKSQVGEQADITVKVIENADDKRTRNGVCSSFLWHRLDVGDMVPVTLESISKFRLPEDDNVPIVMIGAGTGVAPFRGFLQERFARDARGKNWLMFGERNSQSDFLYKDDLTDLQNKGMLHELNTAFSRDQNEKIYVSHIIEERAANLLDWIENGAVVYVCGSKDKLAASVRNSFVKILSNHHGINSDEAKRRLEQLKANKQFQEEVY